MSLVVVICLLLYWPFLGTGGLTMSEGHRAIPAWEMLETGEWLVPHMFGQPYLRKPPGMAWAIAGVSAVLGQTALAARTASALAATAMALVAAGFSARWFGRRWLAVGGLAQALMPQMWVWGRTAEIETLHALGAQLLLFGLIDAARARRSWLGPACLALGVVIAGLTKGPAAGPCLIGGLGGAWIAFGPRAAFGPRIWLGLGVSSGVVGATLLQVRARAAGLDAVTQGIDEFLWQPGRVASILSLPVSAWASALPISLAWLFVWGSDAPNEAKGEYGGGIYRLARALAWAWLVAMVVSVAAGVSNPRYALPAASLFAPLAAYVFAMRAHAMTERRVRFARAMALGGGRWWVLLLVIGGWVFMLSSERRARARSGEEAGTALGARITETASGPTVSLAADHLVEARPEVLWAARREAARRGVGLNIRWIPGGMETPVGFELLALRSDAGSPESVLWPNLETLARGEVAQYAFRVVPGPGPEDR